MIFGFNFNFGELSQNNVNNIRKYKRLLQRPKRDTNKEYGTFGELPFILSSNIGKTMEQCCPVTQEEALEWYNNYNTLIMRYIWNDMGSRNSVFLHAVECYLIIEHGIYYDRTGDFLLFLLLPAIIAEIPQDILDEKMFDTAEKVRLAYSKLYMLLMDYLSMETAGRIYPDLMVMLILNYLSLKHFCIDDKQHNAKNNPFYIFSKSDIVLEIMDEIFDASANLMKEARVEDVIKVLLSSQQLSPLLPDWKLLELYLNDPNAPELILKHLHPILQLLLDRMPINGL